MRSWPLLALAGGLVLFAVFLLQKSSETTRGVDEQREPGSSAERPVDPVDPGTRDEVAGGGATEVEEEGNPSRPIPGTERWHYEEYVRLAAGDADGFDRVADAKADSDAPLQERVALLRVAWKVRGKAALPWFSRAFVGRGGAADEASVALRRFVVRHLAPHARDVPDVRDFLREQVFLDASASAADRSSAARALLETADPREILAMREAIRGISDPAVTESALVGLGLNVHPDAAIALTWLSTNHPKKSVRDRAAEVFRQRRTGDVGKGEED